MNSILGYDQNAYLPMRFISLVYEGVKPTPTKKHKANFVEKLGDVMLYIPENLPGYIKNLCTNPQAITISIFATAHLANSYLFYPDLTEHVIQTAISYIPEISSEVIRFSAWSISSNLITGYCARAGGRLTNEYIKSLMPKEKDN